MQRFVIHIRLGRCLRHRYGFICIYARRVEKLALKFGKGSNIQKILFSLLLVFINRLIVTVTAFVASGHKFIPDLFDWNLFKQAAYTSLTRYDSGWYAQIARWGYANVKSSAFFPLYPLLMRGLSWFAGFSYKMSGQLISTICIIVSLWLVQIITEYDGILRPDTDRRKAGRRIACIIAFNPVSFYYTICYTESLFLMLTLLFMIAVQRKKWFAAGITGLLAGVTRNSGIFLAIIFFLEYFRTVLPQCGSDKFRKCLIHYVGSFLSFFRKFGFSYFSRYRSFFNILFIPAGAIGYFIYLFYRFGRLSSAFSAVDLFGRSSLAPWLTLYRGIRYNIFEIVTAREPYILIYFLLQLITVIIFLSALFYLVKRIPFPYVIFMAASLILPLCKPAHTNVIDYFVSFPRYTATLYPYFTALYGIFHRPERLFIFYLASSIYLLIICVSFWSMGKFIA